MQPQLRPLITIVTVALMAGLSTLAVIMVTRFVGGPSLSISQISTNKQSTFDVSGESKITTVPDQAEVRLGITVNESSVKTAQDKANSVINDINSQLGQLGIEKKDIKTENYSLYPNYDYSPGSVQRITSYSVNANLVVTLTDFAKLNQVIDSSTAAGANQIGGITFSLSDDKKAEVEENARKEAIDDAKDKANELAQLAGMKLGKIVNITETPAGTMVPMYREARLAVDAQGAGGGAPTNVEPGSTSFSYTITLSYETL
jgi:uncharacterized protein YggE